jgi:hypothetical protein
MIHSMVTHLPAVLRPDCSLGERRLDREAASFQARCALRRVVDLLERLRAGGVYDVSSIVIVSDHGYGYESSHAAQSEDPKFRRMVGAFNPTVLVKPPMARGPLTTSDAPLELTDVTRALCSEAGCSPAEGLRGSFDPPAGRGRRSGTPGTTGTGTFPRSQARPLLGRAPPHVESWSRSATAYAPGTAIEFRRGGNVGDYVGFGAGHRQKTHTWMVDPEATVWLKGVRTRPRLRVVVEAQAPTPAGYAEAVACESATSTRPDRVGQRARLPDVPVHRPAACCQVARHGDPLLGRSSPAAEAGRAEAGLAVSTLELRAGP